MNDLTVKTDTIVRTIILILALVNQVLSASGHSVLPIADEQIETAITTVVTIGASVWAWWKNNSFTKHAIKADQILKAMKEEG